MRSIRTSDKPVIGTALQYGHSLTNGLVDCWMLGEQSLSQARNALTGQSSTSTIIPPASGSLMGLSRVFDGATSNRFLDNSVQVLSNGTDYTVWCYFIPTAIGAIMSLVDSDDNLTERMFQLRTNASNQFEFIAFNTVGSSFSATSSITFFQGKPNTLAGTVRGTAVNVWANGVLHGSATLTGTLRSSASTIRLGLRLAISNPFTGNLLIAARWNRALTNMEIAQLHASPYSMFAGQPSNATYIVTNSTGVRIGVAA